MVHRMRIIGPGIAAAALLAFSGMAGAQAPVAPATDPLQPRLTSMGIVQEAAAPAADPCATQETSGPDTDNIQEGDQTGPDQATGSAEASGPDTDNIQEGDQIGPDEACGTGPTATTGSATALSSVVRAQSSALQASDAVPVAADNTPEVPSESSTESDGPGGHEDTGANADHQFEGQE